MSAIVGSSDPNSYDGERSHCLGGQSCPASVASQANLDAKDTSLIKHPLHRMVNSPEEML